MDIIVASNLEDLWFYDIIIYKNYFKDYKMSHKSEKLLLPFSISSFV